MPPPNVVPFIVVLMWDDPFPENDLGPSVADGVIAAKRAETRECDVVVTGPWSHAPRRRAARCPRFGPVCPTPSTLPITPDEGAQTRVGAVSRAGSVVPQRASPPTIHPRRGREGVDKSGDLNSRTRLSGPELDTGTRVP